MFTKKTHGRSAAPSSRRRRRYSSWKLTRLAALGMALGMLLSCLLAGLIAPPSIAQRTAVPNQAVVQYDTPNNTAPPNNGDTEDEQPNDGEDGGRSDTPSNTVIYTVGTTVAGESTLGLSLVKTADKSAAEPGDVVLYQLLIPQPKPDDCR